METFYLTFNEKYPGEIHPRLLEAHAEGYVIVEAANEQTAYTIVKSHVGMEFEHLWNKQEFIPEAYPLGQLTDMNNQPIVLKTLCHAPIEQAYDTSEGEVRRRVVCSCSLDKATPVLYIEAGHGWNPTPPRFPDGSR